MNPYSEMRTKSTNRSENDFEYHLDYHCCSCTYGNHGLFDSVERWRKSTLELMESYFSGSAFWRYFIGPMFYFKIRLLCYQLLQLRFFHIIWASFLFHRWGHFFQIRAERSTTGFIRPGESDISSKMLIFLESAMQFGQLLGAALRLVIACFVRVSEK